MIHLGDRIAIEAEVPDIVDDADNAQPGAGLEAGGDAQAATDRVLVREIPALHRPVDDRDAIGASGVRVGEEATVDQRDPHGREVAGRDVALIDDHPRACLLDAALDLDRVGIAHA